MHPDFRIIATQKPAGRSSKRSNLSSAWRWTSTSYGSVRWIMRKARIWKEFQVSCDGNNIGERLTLVFSRFEKQVFGCIYCPWRCKSVGIILKVGREVEMDEIDTVIDEYSSTIDLFKHQELRRMACVKGGLVIFGNSWHALWFFHWRIHFFHFDQSSNPPCFRVLLVFSTFLVNHCFSSRPFWCL